MADPNDISDPSNSKNIYPIHKHNQITWSESRGCACLSAVGTAPSSQRWEVVAFVLDASQTEPEEKKVKKCYMQPYRQTEQIKYNTSNSQSW